MLVLSFAEFRDLFPENYSKEKDADRIKLATPLGQAVDRYLRNETGPWRKVEGKDRRERRITLFLKHVEEDDRVGVSVATNSNSEIFRNNFNKGIGDFVRQLAIYYWFHLDEDRRVYAEKIDQEGLGVPIHEFLHLGRHQFRQTSENHLNVPRIQQTKPELYLTLFKNNQSQVTHHFTKRGLDVVGRTEDMVTLRSFATSDTPFAWMQIAGAAGLGKSRLALDFADELSEQAWDAGFLTPDELARFEGSWEQWVPLRPTLIVVDYVFGQEKSLGHMIRALTRRRDLSPSVRVLIVERQRWDGLIDGNHQENASAGYAPPERADWYLKMTGDLSGHDEVISQSRSKPSLISLSRLDSEDLIQITIDWAKKFDPYFEIDRGIVAKSLGRIDRDGRPLYAYFLGETLGVGEQPASLTQELLLQKVLEREYRRRWEQRFPTQPPRLSADTPAMRLAVLATMVGKLDVDYELAADSFYKSDPEAPVHAGILTDDLSSNDGAFLPAVIHGLQPDLLGEYFVLYCLGRSLPLNALALRAWEVAPSKTVDFLMRSLTDFPELETIHRLINLEPPTSAHTDLIEYIVPLTRRVLTAKIAPPSHLVSILKIKSSQNDANAMVLLGYMTSKGIGVDKDEVTAVELFRSASDADNDVGLRNLGVCYIHGRGVEKDEQRGFKLVLDAAERGNAPAMFDAGKCYLQGQLVAFDHAKGLNWITRAAEAGHTPAMSYLGTQFDNDPSVPKPNFANDYWLRRAASKFCEQGMIALAIFHIAKGDQKSIGESKRLLDRVAAGGSALGRAALGLYHLSTARPDVEKASKLLKEASDEDDAIALFLRASIEFDDDPVLAVDMLQRSAELGHADAMWYFSACLLEGEGIPQDEKKGIFWLQKAAEANQIEALLDLCRRYFEGDGVDADPAKCRQMIERAAALGSSNAMLLLGGTLLTGELQEKDEASAFSWFERSAELGNASAMLELGRCFKYGKGVETDLAEAFRWFEAAAESDDASGMYELAYCYRNGTGRVANETMAFHWFERSAQAGDARARFSLAVCYQNGLGTAIDPKKAFELFMECSDNGDYDGTAFVGQCYEDGFGTTQDLRKAIHYYEAAAAADNDAALNSLGICLINGVGIDQDQKRGFELCLKAAEQGNPAAMSNVGVFYSEGKGVAKDYQAAIEWYEKAIDAGNPEAMKNLGVCLKYGNGIDVNLVRSFELFEASAKAGIPQGMWCLGVAYRDGIGVDQDFELAFHWLLTAANTGNMPSMNDVAMCYQDGIGIKPDLWTGANWYERAAKAGDPRGMANLGFCYFHGKGRDRDLLEAFELFKIAAHSDEASAMNMMGWYLRDGQTIEKDEQAAVEWFARSAAAGDVVGMANYGEVLLLGEGIDKDVVEGIDWVRRAAEAGNPGAMCNLGACYTDGIGLEIDHEVGFHWSEKAAAAGSVAATSNLGLAFRDGEGVDPDQRRAAAYFEDAAASGHARSMALLSHCYRYGKGVPKSIPKAAMWSDKALENGYSGEEHL